METVQYTHTHTYIVHRKPTIFFSLAKFNSNPVWILSIKQARRPVFGSRVYCKRDRRVSILQPCLSAHGELSVCLRYVFFTSFFPPFLAFSLFFACSPRHHLLSSHIPCRFVSFLCVCFVVIVISVASFVCFFLCLRLSPLLAYIAQNVRTPSVLHLKQFIGFALWVC